MPDHDDLVEKYRDGSCWASLVGVGDSFTGLLFVQRESGYQTDVEEKRGVIPTPTRVTTDSVLYERTTSTTLASRQLLDSHAFVRA